MITFVTDIRNPSEPEILPPLAGQLLDIRSLDGRQLMAFPAPAIGWTHATLQQLAHSHITLTQDGADAFLGGVWVGSTEV